MINDKQALIERLQKIESLSNEDKSSLIRLLREHKKYGLVWEDKVEEAEEVLDTKIPLLEEVKDRAIINKSTETPNHIIIEGDNLHALTVLSYTHSGLFDVIYIDPPYNTGAKNWKYNNDYVDNQDSFRHSKWISFMNRRLKIAKQLLSNTGVIVATIDDYEIENLTLLMNEIFGEDNRLGTFVIKNNPSGRSTLTGVSISHEYALFYGKTSDASLGRLPRTEKQLSRYGEKDEQGYYEWVNFRKHGGFKEDAPSMYYPIYIKKDGSGFRIPLLKWNDNTREYTVLEQPNYDEVVSYPIDEEGRQRRWKWGLERALTEQKDMTIRLDRSKNYAVYIKARMKDDGMLPLTVWDDTKYSSTEYGTNLLANIIGKGKFDYPKSLYAVIDCLKVAHAGKDAKVLDFFAGSGTTLHATMMLNQEDGGQRQCFLITNNENNICEEVTYERSKRVILGYTDSRGRDIVGLTKNNLRYYKVVFTERERTNKNLRELVYSSTDMLCVKNNIYSSNNNVLYGKKLNPKVAQFFVEGTRKMLVIYDERAVLPIIELLRDNLFNEKILVYVFSNSRYAYDDEFAEISNNVITCALPAAIFDAYKKVLKPVIKTQVETPSAIEGESSNEPLDDKLF